MRFSIGLCLIFVLLASASALGCTGVVISGEETVVVGVNEDWYRSDAYVWATKAFAGLHAAVYFGYLVDGEFGEGMAPFWYDFQGINDAGLFFDSFSAPCGIEENESEKRPFSGSIERLIMQTCSTVEDAVHVMTQYDRSYMDCMQYLLVDRTGAAAVVEAGAVVWKDDDVLALTNFHLSDPTHGYFPCERYDRATRLLAEDDEVSVSNVAAILNAAHVPSTCYSLVCDLGSDCLAIYRTANYLRSHEIDLKQLWSEGSDRVPLSSFEYTRN
ncbi:hypothetical protein IH601_04435 [Candidatus Bipolaricaulota bacterium]|nr:hypothetical protein [Candidatus Bipolaricaulota bacterium]